MTIKEVLKKYNKIEIELLLAEVLKQPKEFLYLNGEHKLTNKQCSNLAKLIERREKGEPMAYILGYKDFMGLRFKVNKDVLIPRPETEEMVERIMKHEAGSMKQEHLTILDVGTGSGCIAISIAHLLKTQMWKKYTNVKKSHISVVASDVSLLTLKVAKANAKYHKVKIEFIKSDLLENIKGKFDIIVANLPYVPSADYKKLKDNLKYEPKNAIFANESGLLEIKRLLEQISNLKYQPKLIYLEFDPRQKVLLLKLIKSLLPEYQAEFFKDLSNHWRFVEIKKIAADAGRKY